MMDERDVQFERTESAEERIKRKHAEAVKNGKVVDLTSEEEERTPRKKPRQHDSNPRPNLQYLRRQTIDLTIATSSRDHVSASALGGQQRPRQTLQGGLVKVESREMAQQQVKAWQMDDAAPMLIVDALESGDLVDTISILHVIWEATIQTDDSRHEFAAVGTISATVSVMKQHSTEAEVQALTCLVLFSMAFDNVENQKDIVLSGGVAMILRAMLNHKNSVNVQENACAALVALIYTDEARQSLINSDGIEIVLTAAKKFRNQISVQKTTCEILASLASNTRCQASISQSGGILVIVDAMVSHPSSRAVQDWACRALASLCYENKGNAAVITQAGGVTSILSAMRQDIRWFEVHISASAALRNLSAVSETIKTIILESGGITTIKQCMAAHRGLDYVQKACQDAIDSLSGPKSFSSSRFFGLEDVVTELFAKFAINKL